MFNGRFGTVQRKVNPRGMDGPEPTSRLTLQRTARTPDGEITPR
jgi:hypothetical protein